MSHQSDPPAHPERSAAAAHHAEEETEIENERPPKGAEFVLQVTYLSIKVLEATFSLVHRLL